MNNIGLRTESCVIPLKTSQQEELLPLTKTLFPSCNQILYPTESVCREANQLISIKREVVDD